jgi:hypothetical protein
VNLSPEVPVGRELRISASGNRWKARTVPATVTGFQFARDGEEGWGPVATTATAAAREGFVRNGVNWKGTKFPWNGNDLFALNGPLPSAAATKAPPITNNWLTQLGASLVASQKCALLEEKLADCRKEMAQLRILAASRAATDRRVLELTKLLADQRAQVPLRLPPPSNFVLFFRVAREVTPTCIANTRKILQFDFEMASRDDEMHVEKASTQDHGKHIVRCSAFHQSRLSLPPLIVFPTQLEEEWCILHQYLHASACLPTWRKASRQCQPDFWRFS